MGGGTLGTEYCRGLHLVTPAMIGELLSGEQFGDDRNGLFEDLLAFLGRGPLRARDVLVPSEVTASARAEARSWIRAERLAAVRSAASCSAWRMRDSVMSVK